MSDETDYKALMSQLRAVLPDDMGDMSPVSAMTTLLEQHARAVAEANKLRLDLAVLIGPKPMSGHTIAWRIENQVVSATMTCHEPPGSPCHVSGYYGDRDGYPVCNAISYTDGYSTWEEVYEGPDESLRDGPVNLWWSGDDWLWAYADKKEAAKRGHQ